MKQKSHWLHSSIKFANRRYGFRAGAKTIRHSTNIAKWRSHWYEKDFYCHANKTHFYKKGFVLSIVIFESESSRNSDTDLVEKSKKIKNDVRIIVAWKKKPEENVRCRAGENWLDVGKKSGNSTLHVFFQLLIESSKRISINISGEMALNYGNLQSFMVILPKRAEILLYKVAKFYRHFYGWGYQLKFAPNTKVCKIPRLCGAIFVCFKVTFKLGNFTDFKAFSSA